MFRLITIALSFLLISCIPIKIPPKIEDHKVMKARKFKRDLPHSFGFVFKDPKEADEFYFYINSKFDLGFDQVETNVPMEIDNKLFYLSFHEREKASETLNLIPLVIDGALGSAGHGPFLEAAHTSRSEYWYIILTVEDNDMKDVLDPQHDDHRKVVDYLSRLRQEYINTHQYSELAFKKK
ncbi:MAG: hypothetical protein ABF293_08850 [Flavobacteriaceae bacterium]